MKKIIISAKKEKNTTFGIAVDIWAKLLYNLP